MAIRWSEDAGLHQPPPNTKDRLGEIHYAIQESNLAIWTNTLDPSTKYKNHMEEI